MSFIKRKNRVHPAHVDWMTCPCQRCDEYRGQLLIELQIAKNIVEALG